MKFGIHLNHEYAKTDDLGVRIDELIQFSTRRATVVWIRSSACTTTCRRWRRFSRCRCSRG